MTTTPTSSTAPDPLAIFGQLVREVDAAKTLIVLTLDGDARRRAALDGLALARDLLADAAGLFSDPILGQPPGEEATPLAVQLRASDRADRLSADFGQRHQAEQR